MPNADDLFNQLIEANSKLASINTHLVDVKASTDAVKSAVNQVNTTLANGFGQLISQGDYANNALYVNTKQNETIICILEHISKNTCELLNQSVLQTALQTEIQKDMDALEDMYEHVHADAALERARLLKLKAQVEKCCPPPVPRPPCNYGPCPTPPKLEEPKRDDKPPTTGEPPKVMNQLPDVKVS
jgi:hypothetical protein